MLRITRLNGLIAATRWRADHGRAPGHQAVRRRTAAGGHRPRAAAQARLLLLDEVTSQLDAVNEAALRETIAESASTTTMLVVAHRLSTVTMADRIVVMDAGRVRAIGSHAELVASDPLYGELAATQFLATAD